MSKLFITRFVLSVAFLVVTLSFYVSSIYAAAGINQTINFQGKLVGSNGLNVADGNYDIVFTLYDDPSAGSQIWTETWNSGTTQVSVTDGIFRVALGTHSSMSAVDFNQDAMYLAVKVGADAYMTPRIRFTSVPYAFVAKTVVNDALDFAQLEDTLDLDASTSITADGAEVLSIVNTGTGYSFLVEDQSTDTTPFVIDASGNVGIGTTAPAATLDVTGNAQITGGDLYITRNAQVFNSSTETITSLSTGFLDFIARGSVSFYIDSNANGSNSFDVFANGSSAKIFTILDTGNVGIGTTSPEALLEVQGAEATNSVLALDADDGDDAADTWFLTSVASNNNLTFNNDTSPIAYMKSSGQSGGLLSLDLSTAAPGTCAEGEIYTNDTDGNIYYCTATDTWVDLTVQGSSYTFSDGLTESPAGTVKLGGTNSIDEAIQITNATGGSFTIDLAGTAAGENFIIEDGGTAFATFDNTGFFSLDNLKMDGNTLSITDTNGNLTLNANGTGDVYFNGGTYNLSDTGDLTIGGRLTFENSEYIDNETNGVVNIVSPSTVASGDLTVSGGDITGVTGESIDLGENTADTITFTVGASGELTLDNTTLAPVTPEGLSLGSATSEYEQLFVGDNSGIAFGLDQDFTLGYDEATDDRLELTSTAATGLTISTGATTGSVLALTNSANTLTSGDILNVSSTSTGLTSGSLVDLYWNPGSTTVSTGDLFKIDIGQYGTAANLFAVYNNGTELFSIDQSKITSALPHEFTSAGDVSFAYDIIMTNPTAAYMTFEGPGYIRTQSPSANNDLTLSAANAGSVVVNDLLTVDNADPSIVFDTLTATDTDFWMGIQEDAGSDDDDKFMIGKGTTIGTTPYLTIDASGNVGIGTTTPNDTLDVVGNIDTSGIYKIDGTQVISNIGGTDSLFFGTGGGSASGANYNTSVGVQALNSITSADNNVAIGWGALATLSSAGDNVAIGSEALYSNTSGNNVGIGRQAGYQNNGLDNTFIGYTAGQDYLTGAQNTFIGSNAGYGNNASGDENTVIGYNSLTNITSGYQNTVLGANSGATLTTGYLNTMLGYNADVSSNNITSSIAIGYASLITASNQLVIGNSQTNANITDAYFGEGVLSATPGDITFNATGGTGTDIAGANFILAGGKGTGAGDGGDLIFKTADTLTTGVTLQSLTEKMRITDNGLVGIGTTSPEALLEVQGAEATDSVIALDADDGDDAVDTWFLTSVASNNNLTFNNDTSAIAYMKSSGQSGGLLAIDLSTAAPGTCTEGEIYTNDTDGNIYYCTATDTWVDLTAGGAGGTPAGSDTQIQYNDGGAFGGMSAMTYNDGTLETTITDDLTLTFAGTENLAVTSDLAGTVNILDIAGTPSASAGTAYGIYLSQVDSANSNGFDAGIVIDNLDTDLAIADGLLITSAAGAITDAIDASDAEIVNALNVGENTITGAGYLVTSTASGLTVNSTSANLALQTTTSGDITATTGAASGLFNVLTGNLKVGNGTPSTAQDGEDAYIEGNLEVDSLAGTGTRAVYADTNGLLTNTAPTSGTIGYWSRTGTVLSAATANDTISVANTTTTGADIAITNTGVYTGTGIFNLTANSATTGTLANISGTALTSGNGLIIQGPTSGSTLTGNLLQINTASTGAATNGFVRYNFSGAHTGNGIQIDDATATGTALALNTNSLTTGDALNITSTSTALTTGSLADLYWNPSGSTEIFSTGDVFKINVGQYANPTNIFAVYDNGTELFSIDQAKITSALPHEFTSAGDVSFAYDAIFTNNSAAYIKFEGPGYVQTSHPSGNYNLTLSAANTGVVDIADLATVTGVNAAAASANALTLSGTLGNMDGSDTFRGLYVNYTNGTHTNSNTINGIDIGAITASANATETALNIGTGWDTPLAITKSASGIWAQFADGTDTFGIYNRATTPEGNIAADIGSLAIDTSAGTLYIKTTDTANTGWSAVGTGGSTTLDGAYNNCGGACAITVDAGDVSWNVATGYEFNIASSSTTASNRALDVSQTGATTGTDYAGYFSNTGAATQNTGVYVTSTGSTTAKGLELSVNGSTSAYGIDMNISNGSTGATYGVNMSVTGNSGTSVRGVSTASVAGNGGTAYGVYSQGGSSGQASTGYGGYFTASGSTTNMYSLNVAQPSGATHDSALVIGTVATTAGDWSIYNASTSDSYFAGNIGLGDTTPDAKLNVLSTTEQLRLDYDDSNYASFTVGAAGDMTVDLLDAAADRTLTFQNSNGTFVTNLSVEGDLTVSGGDLYVTPQATSASTTEGTLYYDSDDDNLYVYANGGWVDLTAQGGAGPWTDGATTTYLTDTNEDFNVGATNTLVAPFSVDVSANTVRIGSGATANAVLNMYASDGATGTITYNTSDEWNLTGGNINLDGALDLDTSSATALTVGDGTNNYLTVDTTTDAGDTLFTFTDAAQTLSTGTFMSLVADTITTGTGINLSADGLTSGDALNITSTSTALTTGSLADLYWNPSGSTEIFSTGDVFKINVGQYANPTNIFAVYDNGTELFSIDQAKITSALPHEFTAAGDVSFAYDLILTNQTSSKIEAYGPLTIEGGESSENNNMTLKTYGTGNFIFDNGTTTEMFIDGTNDRVGIGTTGPAQKLHVYRSTDGAPVRFEDSNGYCEIDPTSTTWTCTSDIRLKKDIEVIDNAEALRRITQLESVTFRWNKQDSTDQKNYGLIAQDVESIFPEFVTTSETGMKSVAYGSFTPVLISAISAQQVQIEALHKITDSIQVPADIDGPLKFLSPIEVSDITVGSLKANTLDVSGITFAQKIDVDTVEGQLASIDTRVVGLESRMDGVEYEIAQLKDQIASMSAQLENINGQFVSWQQTVGTGSAVLGASGSATLADNIATLSGLLVDGKTTTFDLTVLGNINAGLLEIGGVSGSEINSMGSVVSIQALAQGGIEFVGGKLTIDTDGNLTTIAAVNADTLESREIVAKRTGEAAPVVGEGTIVAGQTQVTITNANVATNSKIFVTATTSTGSQQLIVKSKANGSFVVAVESVWGTNIKFDYWILGVK